MNGEMHVESFSDDLDLLVCSVENTWSSLRVTMGQPDRVMAWKALAIRRWSLRRKAFFL
jgi:hypothetical protein